MPNIHDTEGNIWKGHGSSRVGHNAILRSKEASVVYRKLVIKSVAGQYYFPKTFYRLGGSLLPVGVSTL